MTRILILSIIICCSVAETLAQQDPYYAHFTFNKQAYNPAAVGSLNDYICLSAVGHNQWLGFDDQTSMNRSTGATDGFDKLPTNVAPTTYNFNIGGQLVSRGVRLGGIGLSIYDDRLGATKMTSVKSQVSYFIHFKNGNRLSVGGEIGLSNFGFVNPQFKPRQLFDPKIPLAGITTTKVDLAGGLYYTQPRFFRQSNSFYAGLSVQHLNRAKFHLVSQNVDLTYQLAHHYYFVTGLSIPSRNGLFDLKPAILIKYNSKPQVNLNMIAERNKQYRFGLGYRQGGNADAIIGYLGYVKQAIVFGYSYDFTLSKIHRVSAGTHELAVKWCFQKKTTFYHKTPREM